MSEDHYDDCVCIDALIKARRNIRLGLCCINNTLNMNKKARIYCNRTCIIKNYSVEKAKELSLQNVKDVLSILKWNNEHNIKHYRLSSDMYPHITNPKVDSYTIDFSIPELKKIGEYAIENKHRLTMHPGQWNQIGAYKREVFDQTVKDLEYHCSLLDVMGMDNNSILCIHGGGTYGDKETTMRRWVEQFDDLPKNVKNRIAIENCEKCYSVEDCLELSSKCNIPVIYDSHHYYCYDLYHPDEVQKDIRELMPEIIESWGKRRPLFHIAEQKPNSPVGAHSEMIENIPGHILEIPYIYDIGIDIEVEAKNKEEAVLYLMKKYHLK